MLFPGDFEIGMKIFSSAVNERLNLSEIKLKAKLKYEFIN